MNTKPTIIKPDSRENKTTIQVTKSLKNHLEEIGLKRESYNQTIERLITCFEKHNPEFKKKPNEISPTSGQIQIGKNVMLSKYESVTISISDYINTDLKYGPKITLEITYNKPFNKEDELYQIDLKINKIIFDNEIYSPKEFFGILQKDMSYCKEFVYYYLRAVLEIIKVEFKKSNYFFKDYSNYFDLARWRTFLLNSKLSPEILSSDVERVLLDLNNKKTNNRLLKDVKEAYYSKIKEYGGNFI